MKIKEIRHWIHKRKMVLAGLAVLIALFVLVGSLILGERGTQEPEETGLAIRVASVEKGEFLEELEFLGTIESEALATLSGRMAGDVEAILVQEGQMVEEGDVLLEVDQTALMARRDSILAARDKLESQIGYLDREVRGFRENSPLAGKVKTLEDALGSAREELGTTETLYKEGVISRNSRDKAAQQVDQLELQLGEVQASLKTSYDQLVQERTAAGYQLEELQAGIREIEVSLEAAQVRAPFDGRVRAIMVEVGDLAAAGKPLIQLDRQGPVIASVMVPGADLGRIREGMAVRGGEDGSVRGQVRQVAASVNPQTRLGRVEVELEGAGEYLLGEGISVGIVLEERQDAVIIPRQALRSLGEKNLVYVLDGTLVVEKEVRVGGSHRDMVEIVDGLEEGDQVAVSGLNELYDGAPVLVFPEERA